MIPRAVRPLVWAVGLLLAWSCALSLSPRLAAQDADAYALWGHGHPQEAVPLLLRKAQADDHWDSWLDAGLAAAASGDKGHAVAWLLRAHQRSLDRQEPRTALRMLGAELPPSWIERSWPLSWPGCGWPGLICLGIAGLGLGFACCSRRGRLLSLVCACLAVLAAAPGQICLVLDGRIHLIAVVHDTHLLDASGNPGALVVVGTAVVREGQTPWPSRILVRLANGQRGFLPTADCLDPWTTMPE